MLKKILILIALIGLIAVCLLLGFYFGKANIISSPTPVILSDAEKQIQTLFPDQKNEVKALEKKEDGVKRQVQEIAKPQIQEKATPDKNSDKGKTNPIDKSSKQDEGANEKPLLDQNEKNKDKKEDLKSNAPSDKKDKNKKPSQKEKKEAKKSKITPEKLREKLAEYYETGTLQPQHPHEKIDKEKLRRFLIRPQDVDQKRLDDLGLWQEGHRRIQGQKNWRDFKYNSLENMDGTFKFVETLSRESNSEKEIKKIKEMIESKDWLDHWAAKVHY